MLDLQQALLALLFLALRFVQGLQLQAFLLLQVLPFAVLGLPLGAGHLPVHQAFDLPIRGALVTGDLVDAKVLVQILEVVLLHPALEHEEHDGLGFAIEVIGEDGYLRDLAAGIGGLHFDLSQLGVLCPGLFPPIKLITAGVLRAVDAFVQAALSAHGALFPGGRHVVFLPGDEVQVLVAGDAFEDFVAVDAAVYDEGERAARLPLQGLTQALDEGEDSRAQVFVVVRAFEVDGRALRGVNVVAVDEFVGESGGLRTSL